MRLTVGDRVVGVTSLSPDEQAEMADDIPQAEIELPLDTDEPDIPEDDLAEDNLVEDDPDMNDDSPAGEE